LVLKTTFAMEGRAVIINRLPSFVQRFFSPMQEKVSKPQFSHLWSLVLAVVVNLRAAKLIHLSATTPDSGHRTRRGAFLNQSKWDSAALIDQAVNDLLTGLKPRKGEVIHLILDDTRLSKRGTKMSWVSKMWDHKQHKFVRGHIVVTAAIAFRGVVLPWRMELWKPKGHPGPRFRKLTHIAADMVKAFVPPAGVKVRVLFDAFYLCPAVTKACETRGFSFFSVAGRNRCFTTANGKRRSLGKLMPGLIRYHGKNVRMKRSRRHTRLRIACVDGRLSKIGRVRVVVSKRPRGPWKKCIAIVTNESGLRPRQVVAIYEKRWLIEVLFKELVQDLGLSDYQMLTEDGIVHHLHVCGLAHLLLTHHSLQGLGAKATKANTQVQIPPMSQRLAQLRTRIARDQIDHLIGGATHATLRKKLCDYLLAG
jgi:SRSO17 transposase